MAPSKEFDWLCEIADSLPAKYEFRWIAVDGARIGSDNQSMAEIVVADGDTLGEVIAIVQTLQKKPIELFYAFIRPNLSEGLKRQEDAEVYGVAGST